MKNKINILLTLFLLSGMVSASGAIPVLYMSEKSFITSYCQYGVNCPDMQPEKSYIMHYFFIIACVMVLIALVIKIKNIIGHTHIKMVRK